MDRNVVDRNTIDRNVLDRNVVDLNVVDSVPGSVKKQQRRSRARQKSLPANRLDDCVYVTTDQPPHYLTLIPSQNCQLLTSQQNCQMVTSQNCQLMNASHFTNGVATNMEHHQQQQPSPPPPPAPLAFEGPEYKMTSSHDHMTSSCGPVVSDTCWQFEHRRSKSCHRLAKKRMSIQAEAIQLDDEPPPPPPPPIFCSPDLYDRVLPPPPQMMSCENDDIVAVVEDHRHRERRRPPMPAPQPKPRCELNYIAIFLLQVDSHKIN